MRRLDDQLSACDAHPRGAVKNSHRPPDCDDLVTLMQQLSIVDAKIEERNRGPPSSPDADLALAIEASLAQQAVNTHLRKHAAWTPDSEPPTSASEGVSDDEDDSELFDSCASNSTPNREPLSTVQLRRMIRSKC